jgi:hypothetical protein
VSRRGELGRAALEIGTGIAMVSSINYTNHNGLINDGKPNKVWQSSAVAAAAAAPLVLVNTLSSDAAGLVAKSSRLAAGSVIAGAVGAVLHPMNNGT